MTPTFFLVFDMHELFLANDHRSLRGFLCPDLTWSLKEQVMKSKRSK